MSTFRMVAALLLCTAPIAYAVPIALNKGESFTDARARLYADGWRADALAHAATGEYMGLDRQLAQRGFFEVDYCSVGRSLCILQYTKGSACLRVHTQGEQIALMKVESYSSECRERGPSEDADTLPADVRYFFQRRDECETLAECSGVTRFQLKLQKKYMHDPVVMKVLTPSWDPSDGTTTKTPASK